MKSHIAIERLLLVVTAITAAAASFWFANSLYQSARGEGSDLQSILAVAAFVLPMGLILICIRLSYRLSWQGMRTERLIQEGVVISILVFGLAISVLERWLLIAYIWPLLLIGLVIYGLFALREE